MSKQYSPKCFFRQVPNCLLKQYFDSRGVLIEINFSSLTETKIEPIYEACLKLPEDVQSEIERDFQEMEEFVTKDGIKATLSEARYNGEDLAEQFSQLDGFYAHAFWTFLERLKYWHTAIAFNHADQIPTSYWWKRKNIPHVAAMVSNIRTLIYQPYHSLGG